MNISITFRHMASSEAIKSYTSDKLGKLQKFLRQPMTAKVTLSIDRMNQIAEARISSGGEHLEAKESGEDMYASIDKIMSKLERQIRASHGAAVALRRGADSVRTESQEALVAPGGESAKRTLPAKKAVRSATKKAPAKKTKRR
jgi:putative sigma-54 modulation protein